jgi:hypothetical protein
VAEERIVIPLAEFSNNLSNILRRILHEHRVFWVEGESGEFVEMKAAPGQRRTRRKTSADLRAFMDAAGSWGDVNTDAFAHVLREQRDQSYRPLVDL